MSFRTQNSTHSEPTGSRTLSDSKLDLSLKRIEFTVTLAGVDKVSIAGETGSVLHLLPFKCESTNLETSTGREHNRHSCLTPMRVVSGRTLDTQTYKLVYMCVCTTLMFNVNATWSSYSGLTYEAWLLSLNCIHCAGASGWIINRLGLAATCVPCRTLHGHCSGKMFWDP